jgi:hypothetical protein
MDDTTRTHITDLLDKLGDTSTDVAATLHRLGITGIPWDTKRCPVARYLQQHTGLPLHVDAGHIYRSGYFGIDEVVPPRAVNVFIAEFDASFYPNLLDNPEINP